MDNEFKSISMAELKEEYEREREQKLRNPVWGDWEYDPERVCLYPKNISYGVDLQRSRTGAQLLDWIFQLRTKSWMTPQMMADFLDAVQFLLHPQQNRCSWGQNKKFRVEEHLARMFERYAVHLKWKVSEN